MTKQSYFKFSKNIVVLCMMSLFFVSAYGRKGPDYSIVKYGAKSDTTFLSTKAIQKAIDDCARNGGGRVIVPAGTFLTGSIFLKDNVQLYLSPGSLLLGSRNVADYIAVKPSFKSFRTGGKTIQLIYAEKAVNVGICGEGTIDGQGRFFKKTAETDEGITRPHLIRFIECENVTVRDVSLKNSGCWMQHFLACENVRLTGLRIFNRSTQNNDGLDLDGCRNVVVSDLIMDTDDDAITLKSTSPRLCENIAIVNCVVSSHCNGIKMGTETNGGFKNIVISNCIVKPSEKPEHKVFGRIGGISGISLEIADGGIMEGVNISNVTIEGTQAPLFIRLSNRARAYAPDVPVKNVGCIRNVSINGIRAIGAGTVGCSITGMPGHPVENILISNSSFSFAGGVKEGGFNQVPGENEKSYPEATMWGNLPAWGFYVRHASNVEFQNVELKTIQPDVRPDYYQEDCK